MLKRIKATLCEIDVQALKDAYSRLKSRAMEYKSRLDADRIEKNRFMVLFISSLLIMDYVLFCFHADKNLFDIFPSFPALDCREERTVYLPDTDGKTLLKEKRLIAVSEDNDEFIRSLFRIILRGSIYENTSISVPVDTFIRKVWLTGDTCVIDLALSTLLEDARIIEGSEANFRLAVEKTVLSNIPSIKNVVILEKGIPGKPIWETAAGAQ
jgi:hypothetical protein